MNDKLLEVTMSFRDRFSPAVAGASRKTTTALERMRAGAKRMREGFSKAIFSVKAFVAALAALVIIRQVVRWMAESVKLAMAQEAAVITLNASLRAAGNYSVEASAGLQKFATSLQRTVGIGDEVTLAMMGTIEALTKLSAEALPDAMRATVGLATMLNMDMKTAAITVGKTLTSSTNALVRYAIEIDMTADAQGRLNQLLEATVAGMKIAEEKAKTYEGQIMFLTNAWGDFREVIGSWITQSPGVLATLEVLTGWLYKLTDSVDAASDSGVDLVGIAFAKIVSGSLYVSRAILALGRGFTQIAIWVKQLSKSLHELWATLMDMPTWMMLGIPIVGPSMAVGRALFGLGGSAQFARDSAAVLQEEIDTLNTTLWSSFDATKAIIKAQTALADAIANTGSIVVDKVEDGGFIDLTNQLDDMAEAAGGVANAMNAVAAVVDRLGRAWEPGLFGMDFIAGLQERFSGGEITYRGGPVRRDPYTGFLEYTDLPGPDTSGPGIRQPPFVKAPGRRPKKGTPEYTAWIMGMSRKGGGGGIPVWQTNDFLTSLAATGIGGFAGGGARGGIAAMLPVIGSAFGPIGGAIGGLLGSLFGKKQKPRGNDPSKPVFVSDISMVNIMTELLNITKSQLGRSGAGGINAINTQIRAQAGTSGAS